MSDDFVFDDRSKRALVAGGVDLWIESTRQFAGPGTGYEREILATYGERIALDHQAWAGETDDGVRWEADRLRLTEVDAEGRIRASISFDPDDRRAAFDEAHARFVAGEAGATPAHVTMLALDRAIPRRDWDAVRDCLADDLVYRDHRKLGLGALARDELVAAIRAHTDLAPDLRSVKLRFLAWNRHGLVAVLHQSGTVPDGGPFENLFLRVIVADGDRIRHFETFDVADADQALARFETLSAEADRATVREGAS